MEEASRPLRKKRLGIGEELRQGGECPCGYDVGLYRWRKCVGVLNPDGMDVGRGARKAYRLAQERRLLEIAFEEMRLERPRNGKEKMGRPGPIALPAPLPRSAILGNGFSNNKISWSASAMCRCQMSLAVDRPIRLIRFCQVARSWPYFIRRSSDSRETLNCRARPSGVSASPVTRSS